MSENQTNYIEIIDFQPKPNRQADILIANERLKVCLLKHNMFYITTLGVSIFSNDIPKSIDRSRRIN